MKYQRNNNKNSLETMKNKKNNLITDDFDTSEYIDEEFVGSNKKSFLKKSRKQEYEYIIDEDEEEIIEEPKKEVKVVKKEEKKEKKTTKKEKVKEEPKLTIEPIRTVTKEEYKDITKKRQEEKERQLKLEKEKLEKKKNKGKRKPKKKQEKESFKLNIRTVINTIFLIIIVLIIITVVDIVSVSKYEKGPYFAINTGTLNDGGTKIYHGIGYKVIKYKQLQGRRDMEIGTWSLEYDIEPITIEDIDLAIRFNKNEVKTYNDLYKKFVRINSTLKKVDKKNNTITIGYEDEEGKYTMDIICDMANKDGKIYDFEVGKEITIIGTVYDMKGKTAKTPTTLKIKNCFAEQ